MNQNQQSKIEIKISNNLNHQDRNKIEALAVRKKDLWKKINQLITNRL